ncbi:MAG: S9 family peptidase [Pyrinomonadaceae bacterium]
MKKPLHLFIQLLLALSVFACSFSFIMAQTNGDTVKPPVAKKIPKEDVTNGDKRIDNYFWFREKTNPEVIKYLEAENAYTDALMKPTEEFQKKLYDEMLSHIKQTDTNVPYRLGDYYYYSRTEEGKQYPIYARKRGSLDASEEITLDLNEMAKGLKFLAIGSYRVSDDGNLLAYTTDTTGYRQYTLQIKDLRTGQLLPDRAERVDQVMWSTDNKTLFYVTEDQVTKRSDKFWRHALGSDKSDLIYDEKDELYDISAFRSKDKAYIFVESGSKTTTEYRYLPANNPTSDLKVFLPRESDHMYYVDHRGDLFYIRTNQGAKNYRLMTAPVGNPQKKNWKEILPHRKDVKLDDFDLFANHLILSEFEGGSQKLRIVDLRNNKAHTIEMPDPVYSVFGDNNPEFNTNVFRYRYQSLVTPSSIYDYDMDARQSTLRKRTEVPGGFDSANYTSERVYAPATDGTKIPISLVYRKGTKLDGKNPMLLYAYGSYGSPTWPGFNSNRLSLLDRGVVYAIAHIRGGGEMGEVWREQGRMMFKKNTFTDFINSAEYLIKQKYTSSDRLVIQGGSAGGLLMGAVVNMRPDLFKAVVAQVPFVDVINTMLDASLPLTTSEYLEWGNPNEKKAYEYIKSYSPYDNIAAKAYPAMLVKVSLNDSQVPYWEGTKFVAKLRAMKTDNNVLLLKVNMGAGHGGSSGRYDALHDIAFDYAFMLTQMGINQ